MEKEKNSIRIIGVDLLKILAMLMIVTSHAINHGSILKSLEVGSYRYQFFSAWEVFVACAVNCYAIISGFVGIKTEIKVKRIIKLWMEVLFYSVGITVIAFFIDKSNVSHTQIYNSFFPIMTERYWYITAYFGMMLLAPLFNHAINNIEKKKIKKIVIVMMLIFSVIFTILKFFPISAYDAFKLNNGYSMLWLCILYIIGAYFGKHVEVKKFKGYKMILGYVIMCAITVGFEFLFESIGLNNYSKILSRYTSPTILAAAIFLLLLFSNININRLKKFVVLMSNATLGVYLIHDNEIVRNNIVSKIFINYTGNSFIQLIIQTVLTILAVYCICSIIDIIRIKLFKLLRIEYLLDTILKNKSKTIQYEDGEVQRR